MLLDGGAYWSRSANPDDVGGAYYLGWDDYGMYEYGGRSDGQCVRPVVNNQCIQLADTTDNSTIIADNDGKTVDVALQGRTLYKDGSWNMLCLPFNISDSSVEGDLQSVEGDLQSPTFANTPLEGAVVMTLESASFANGTLTLNFASATSIAAGTPYIVRWEKADDYADDNDHNLYEPVFMGVTIHAAAPTDISADVITLHGCYSPASIEGEDKTILYLDAGNRLCYPKDAMSINALRGWFLLPEGLINPSLGDVNGDKAITIADVMMIVNNIMGKANDNFLIENADLNGDRQISVADVMALVSIVIGDNNSFDVVTNLDDAPLTFGGAATGPARAKKIKD